MTPRDPIITTIPYFYQKIGDYQLLDYDNSKSNWEHHDLHTYHDCLSLDKYLKSYFETMIDDSVRLLNIHT